MGGFSLPHSSVCGTYSDHASQLKRDLFVMTDSGRIVRPRDVSIRHARIPATLCVKIMGVSKAVD